MLCLDGGEEGRVGVCFTSLARRVLNSCNCAQVTLSLVRRPGLLYKSFYFSAVIRAAGRKVIAVAAPIGVLDSPTDAVEASFKDGS